MFEQLRAFLVPTLSVAVVLFIALIVFFCAPADNQNINGFRVSEGETLTEVVNNLAEENLVRSASITRLLAQMMNISPKTGIYDFSSPPQLLSLLRRLDEAQFGFEQVRVTIPEGVTVDSVADILEDVLKDFDREAFLSMSSGKEGYLFPDTYFFVPFVSEEEIIGTMENNFALKLESLKNQIESSNRTQEEIIIMASILEGEASNEKDRRMIADILWRRLETGKLLQVDAALRYVTGRGSAELTIDDLELDSVYNTYEFLGLPPTPINNPGLATIDAALNPLPNEYWFYLADDTGMTHYGVDFEEHKKNRELYLR